jgi:hypothetical protein
MVLRTAQEIRSWSVHEPIKKYLHFSVISSETKRSGVESRPWLRRLTAFEDLPPAPSKAPAIVEKSTNRFPELGLWVRVSVVSRNDGMD